MKSAYRSNGAGWKGQIVDFWSLKLLSDSFSVSGLAALACCSCTLTMHSYVNRGTFGGASDRAKSTPSVNKQEGRFESSSQLPDQGTAIGERCLKAAVRLAEISIPVIALEKSFHARRLLLCRDS